MRHEPSQAQEADPPQAQRRPDLDKRAEKSQIPSEPASKRHGPSLAQRKKAEGSQ
jgi:hypothetical protein